MYENTSININYSESMVNEAPLASKISIAGKNNSSNVTVNATPKSPFLFLKIDIFPFFNYSNYITIFKSRIINIYISPEPEEYLYPLLPPM